MVFRNAGEGDAEADGLSDAIGTKYVLLPRLLSPSVPSAHAINGDGDADAEGDRDAETDREREVDADGDNDGDIELDGLREADGLIDADGLVDAGI